MISVEGTSLQARGAMEDWADGEKNKAQTTGGGYGEIVIKNRERWRRDVTAGLIIINISF